VLGGIHGNETIGIGVVEQLRDSFAHDRALSAGELYFVLGNSRAIAAGKRFLDDGKDLNRCFNPVVLAGVPDGSYEDARAREIADVLRAVDVSIDIHSTNKPSVPFLACAASPAHQRIFQWFDADRILTDPNYIFAGKPVTTDEYVDQIGGTGICYETGWNQDVGRIDGVAESVCHVLCDHQMLSDRPCPPSPSHAKRIFELTTALIPPGSEFVFAEGMGLNSFQEVQRGQLIGRAGEDELRAIDDGVIVFPKLPEHWRPGSPVCYLARTIYVPPSTTS
jgi:succinylglutamate desuccinylase